MKLSPRAKGRVAILLTLVVQLALLAVFRYFTPVGAGLALVLVLGMTYPPCLAYLYQQRQIIRRGW